MIGVREPYFSRTQGCGLIPDVVDSLQGVLFDAGLVDTHPVVRTMSQRATRSEPAEAAEMFAINVSGRRTEFR